MEYAKGEYIAFLEDTDIWMPNKLKIQISIQLLEYQIYIHMIWLLKLISYLK